MPEIDLLLEHKYSVREITSIGINRQTVYSHHAKFPELWKKYLRLKKQIDDMRLEKKLKI